MSNIRFLVFRGNLQNEGNFFALESDETILIIGAGRDNPYVVKSILNIDYLKENKDKIKAILLNNSSLKNSGSIQSIYDELDLNVPIYGSKITKISLESFYECKENLINNFVEVDNLIKDVVINDFSISFFALDSYLLGNIGISISESDHIFYYLEDFSFNVLSNNNLLFQQFFFQKFRKFLSTRRKKTYLIAGCQNLNWVNNGSLSLESKRFIIKDKEVFLFAYDFDFLHIIETLEIAQKFNRKVNVLDRKMFDFLQKVFQQNSLLSVIKFNDCSRKDNINLLTLSIDEMEKKIPLYLKKNSKYLFVSCLFPMSGCQEKLAKVYDLLHSQNNEFLDLGKSENLSIGTNFYDLKFIIKNLNPNGLILLQNSYKHGKYLSNLKSSLKPTFIPNNHIFNLTTRKISQIKNSNKFLNTENLLFFQREKLLKNGLLVIFLIASWENKKLNISKIRINSLSISTTIDLLKIERKIKQWWDTKISPDSSFFNSDANIKQNIERRLSGLIKNYLSFESDVDMEDPLFLVFIRGNEKKNEI
ncbi:MAG: Ribonuclease J 2 [Mycoplasmataceae bacterium]|nr:MAG: Ribonuclease J 2 [Mycoplasmataceae bacterium]